MNFLIALRSCPKAPNCRWGGGGRPAPKLAENCPEASFLIGVRAVASSPPPPPASPTSQACSLRKAPPRGHRKSKQPTFREDRQQGSGLTGGNFIVQGLQITETIELLKQVIKRGKISVGMHFAHSPPPDSETRWVICGYFTQLLWVPLISAPKMELATFTAAIDYTTFADRANLTFRLGTVCPE